MTNENASLFWSSPISTNDASSDRRAYVRRFIIHFCSPPFVRFGSNRITVPLDVRFFNTLLHLTPNVQLWLVLQDFFGNRTQLGTDNVRRKRKNPKKDSEKLPGIKTRGRTKRILKDPNRRKY